MVIIDFVHYVNYFGKIYENHMFLYNCTNICSDGDGGDFSVTQVVPNYCLYEWFIESFIQTIRVKQMKEWIT